MLQKQCKYTICFLAICYNNLIFIEILIWIFNDLEINNYKKIKFAI